MVHDGVTWFGDLTSNITVNVTNTGIPSDDIGAPGVAGSAFFDGTTYTINGGGADILGGASDQFNYVSDPATGDGTLIAKITNGTGAEVWAKAGVMFRDSLAANSMFIDMVATGGSGVSLQWRASTGGQCGFIQVASVGRHTTAQPVWL